MTSSRFLIRSIDRNKDIYPSASDFSINMGDVVHQTNLIKAVSLTLPMSFYNITQHNNKWACRFVHGLIWQHNEIDPGFYTGDEIRTLFIEKSLYDNDPIMDVYWHPNSQYLSIWAPDNGEWTECDFSMNGTIAAVIGIAPEHYHIVNEEGALRWIPNISIFDTTGGVRLVYILVDFLDTTNSLISTDEDLNTNLFIAIPIQWEQNTTSYGAEELINNSVEFLKPRTIQTIHFTLMIYYHGKPHIVDLNGMDWFIELFFASPLED